MVRLEPFINRQDDSDILIEGDNDYKLMKK